MSPTERTQQFLRRRGMLVANCERKLPCTPAGYRGKLITQDLFGLVDTMALDPTAWDCPLCIQTTSGAGHAARRAKVMASDNTPVILRHARLEIWSWSKRGPRGKRKLWTLRRERFGLNSKGEVFSVTSADPLNL